MGPTSAGNHVAEEGMGKSAGSKKSRYLITRSGDFRWESFERMTNALKGKWVVEATHLRMVKPVGRARERKTGLHMDKT